MTADNMKRVTANEIAALQQAINLAGGPAELARAIDVTRQRLHAWRRAPAEYAPTIERVTLRQVTCEQLREDVEWSVVRARPARKQ
jgi:DNA-binding transcriptional regulator YdaS (Cro superfamily)